MKVIALYSRASCGKTQTLTDMHTNLLSAVFSQVPNQFVNLGNNDFWDVFNDGKRNVGIVTRGDYGKLLKQDLDHLLSQNCTVAVCACRVRGQTKQVVRGYNPHVFIRKTRGNSATTNITANQVDVNTIINQL